MLSSCTIADMPRYFVKLTSKGGQSQQWRPLHDILRSACCCEASVQTDLVSDAEIVQNKCSWKGRSSATSDSIKWQLWAIVVMPRLRSVFPTTAKYYSAWKSKIVEFCGNLHHRPSQQPCDARILPTAQTEPDLCRTKPACCAWQRFTVWNTSSPELRSLSHYKRYAISVGMIQKKRKPIQVFLIDWPPRHVRFFSMFSLSVYKKYLRPWMRKAKASQ